MRRPQRTPNVPERQLKQAERTGTAIQAAGTATQPSSATAMPQPNVQQAQHPSTAVLVLTMAHAKWMNAESTRKLLTPSRHLV